MPELPEVTQEFDANTAPYVAAIEQAIAETKKFVDEIMEAATAIELLKEQLDSIPREVTIAVHYVQTGDAPTGANAQFNSAGMSQAAAANDAMAASASHASSAMNQEAESMTLLDAITTLLKGNEGQLTEEMLAAEAAGHAWNDYLDEAVPLEDEAADALKNLLSEYNRFPNAAIAAEAAEREFAESLTAAYQEFGNVGEQAGALMSKMGLWSSLQKEYAASMDEVVASMEALDATMAKTSGVMGSADASMAKAGATMLALEEAEKALDNDAAVAHIQELGSSSAAAGLTIAAFGKQLTTAAEGIDQLGTASSSGYGYLSLLNKELSLFAGFFGDTHMIGSIQLWHVALDLAFESVVALTEAALALAPALLAMAPAADDIATHLKSIQTVNDALGSNIPPLTGKFQALAKAMAPGVVELYGGALNLINSNGTTTAQVVTEVVQGFDNWIAKLDLFMSTSKDSGAIMKDGVTVLKQFETAMDNLGVAFHNFMAADPGTVHYLLDLFDDFTKLIEVVSTIPAPILEAALALHSFLIYGGLLVTILAKLATPFVSLAAGATRLAAGMGLLGPEAKEAAASLGLLTEAEASAEAESSGLSKVLAATGISGAMQSWVAGIKAAASEADGTFASLAAGAGAALGGIKTALVALASSPWTWAIAGAAAIAVMAYQSTQASAAVKSFINNMNSGLANEKASTAILQITTDLGQLNAKLANTSATTEYAAGWNNLGHTMTSVSMDGRASVTDFTKALSDLGSGNGMAALSAFASGFKAAFVPGSGASIQAANDIKALTQEMETLEGKEKNLFTEAGNLTQSGYTYAASLGLMDQAGVKAGDSLALMAQKVNNLITGYKNMGEQGGALTSAVNAVTLSAEQQQSQIQQLNSSWDSFISLVTGSTTAFAGFEQQMSVIKDATTGLGSGLEESNGQAKTLVKGLSDTGTAAKSTSVSMSGLSSNSIQLQQSFAQGVTSGNALLDTLRSQVSVSGLGAKGYQDMTAATKDVVAQLLPMAEGNKAALASVSALAQEAGGPAVASFTALSNWAGSAKGAEQNLSTIQQQLTVSSAQLAADVQNLAQAINSQLNTSMAAAILQSSGGQTAFNNFATAIKTSHGNTDLMTQSAQKVASMLVQVTGNTTTAKGEFETFATQLGLSKGAADQLWTSLGNLKNQSPINEQIHVDGSGSYSVSTSVVSGARSASGAFEPGAASGMFVGQGTTSKADDVLVRVSKGELIVPENMVSSGAVDHLRGAIPGFASGGVAGGSDIASLGGWAASQVHSTVTQIEQAVAAAVTRLVASLGAAAASAATASGSKVVSAGLYDTGGWLPKGVSMAMNNTGQPEKVIGPNGVQDSGVIHTHVYMDGNKIAECIQPKLVAYNGRYTLRNSGKSTGIWKPT